MLPIGQLANASKADALTIKTNTPDTGGMEETMEETIMEETTLEQDELSVICSEKTRPTGLKSANNNPLRRVRKELIKGTTPRIAEFTNMMKQLKAETIKPADLKEWNRELKEELNHTLQQDFHHIRLAIQQEFEKQETKWLKENLCLKKEVEDLKVRIINLER